jgi:23S rRNA (cytosine1962-C5)-methyltransferase
MLSVRLQKGKEKDILKGFPWGYGGDLISSSEHLLAEAGELAELRNARDEFIGIGTFNAGAPIAFRILTTKREAINASFFQTRLQRALQKREAKFSTPYYRLVHAESDGLPGVIIDRFGDITVIQISTAGMQRLLTPLMEAVHTTLKPPTVIFRNDIAVREQEGLKREITIEGTPPPELIQVHENNCIYLADLLHGQKTGWFFDQRENHKLAASYAAGKSMLDAYCYSGGFAMPAAKAGAQVTLLDSSAGALELAAKAAELNGVKRQCIFRQGDAFNTMQALAKEQQVFDVVVADPPAFIKTKAHIATGMQGYARVARLAAALTMPEGILVVASCSHHAKRPHFREAVLEGLKQAGRTARVLHYTGHDADHPIHPHLPQSEYLKALFMRLD